MANGRHQTPSGAWTSAGPELAHDLFRAIAEIAADIVWRTDAEGRFVSVSGRVRELLGRDAHDLIGRLRVDLIDPESEAERKAHLVSLSQREAFANFVYRVRVPAGRPAAQSLPITNQLASESLRAAGRVRYLRSNGRPLYDEAGAFQGYLGADRDVTAEMRMRQRALERARQFRLIADAANEGIFRLDERDSIIYANRSLVRLLGIRRGNIIGQSLLSFISPDGRDLLANTLVSLRDGGTVQRQLPVIAESGTRLTTLVSLAALHDRHGRYTGAVGMVMDVTARVDAERALAEREMFLKSILENSPTVVFVKDPMARYMLVNERFCELVRRRPLDIIGRRPADLFPPEMARDWEKTIAEVAATGQSLRRREEAVVAGNRFVFDTVYFPLFDGQGEVYAVAGIAMDVTEMQLMQSQLFQAEKLSTVGRMAAGITHELNQPLNVISMAAESGLLEIETGNSDPSFLSRQLKVIASQAERMGVIIRDFRTLLRREDFPKTHFDPCEACRGAARIMERELELADIRLILEVPSASRPARGSQAYLEQVLINLINNSRDAISENPPVAWEDARGYIRLALEDDPARPELVIRISDTGGGIPESVAAHIFEPFFTTKPAGKGTGLGLSIVQQIIQSMDGHLEFENTERGVEFRLYLPVTEPQP